MIIYCSCYVEQFVDVLTVLPFDVHQEINLKVQCQFEGEKISNE